MITHDWGQALVPDCVQPPQSVFAGHVFIMSFCLYVEKLCVGGGSGKQSQGVTVLFTPFYRLVRIPKSRNPEKWVSEPTVRMRPTGKKKRAHTSWCGHALL